MTKVFLSTILFAAGALLAQPPAAQKSNTPPAATVRATSPGGVVDINTADAKELGQLPGISKSEARKIIAHRPYDKVEDLKKAGLSQKSIDRIKPLVHAKDTIQ